MPQGGGGASLTHEREAGSVVGNKGVRAAQRGGCRRLNMFTKSPEGGCGR